jgi:hypothetical protein
MSPVDGDEGSPAWRRTLDNPAARLRVPIIAQRRSSIASGHRLAGRSEATVRDLLAATTRSSLFAEPAVRLAVSTDLGATISGERTLASRPPAREVDERGLVESGNGSTLGAPCHT